MPLNLSYEAFSWIQSRDLIFKNCSKAHGNQWKLFVWIDTDQSHSIELSESKTIHNSLLMILLCCVSRGAWNSRKEFVFAISFP